MLWCKVMFFMALGFGVASLPAHATVSASGTESAIIEAQAAEPMPGEPSTSQSLLSHVTLERVIAVAVGGVAGDFAHMVLGIPSGPTIIAGGVLGYYVYVNYIEQRVGQAARRISALAGDARLYFIEAPASVAEAAPPAR